MMIKKAELQHTILKQKILMIIFTINCLLKSFQKKSENGKKMYQINYLESKYWCLC